MSISLIGTEIKGRGTQTDGRQRDLIGNLIWYGNLKISSLYERIVHTYTLVYSSNTFSLPSLQ